MNLLSQCQALTLYDKNSTEDAFELGSNYLKGSLIDKSKNVEQYLFPFADRKVYLYIWNFHTSSELFSTICPYNKNLSFACPFVPGQKTPTHVQDFLELAYVVKGELHQKILDKDIIFKEGELCLIDRNCAHQEYLLDNNSLILFLCLRNDVLPEIMNENVTTQKIISFLQTALMEQKALQQYVHFRPIGNVRPKMDNCFSLIAKELHEDQIGASYIVKGLLIRIFRLLSTEYEFQLSKQQKKDMNWAVFEDVCHYIEQNYKTVTIQELSEVFHFQEDYFNRLIKKRLGKTYCDVLQDVRLFKAKQLLLQTTMTIAEISEEVGYRNKGYFYKLFSAKYGMTPAEYRKQL